MHSTNQLPFFYLCESPYFLPDGTRIIRCFPATTTGEAVTVMTSQETALSGLLKHAEHGTVEEMRAMLALARLDLGSAMRFGFAYNFDAAKKFFRVLVLNQRRDVIEWLLDNDEIVGPLIDDILLYAYQQPSLNFLLWLHKQLNARFHTRLFIGDQFQTAMEFGAVEIASYILRTFPLPIQTYGCKVIHPNAVEFWRNEVWPLLLQASFQDKSFSPLQCWVGSEDASHAIYALTHGFLSRGLELPAKEKAAYIAFTSRSLDPVESLNAFTTWVCRCVSYINTVLEEGHWKRAKLIVTALQEALPNAFPYHQIDYFCVEHPESMDEKDMREMVEWSVNGLRELLLKKPTLVALGGEDSDLEDDAHALYIDHNDREDGTDAQKIDCIIAGAFVSACDRDMRYACSALLEDKVLAGIIETQLSSYFNFLNASTSSVVSSPWSEFVINDSLRRASTIDVLVRHGMDPTQLKDYTNIVHVWGKDPSWVDWAISGNLRSISGKRTGNLMKDVFLAFGKDKCRWLDHNPYRSMADEEKFKVLQWLGEMFLKESSLAPNPFYFREVLHHPLVTAENLIDFVWHNESTRIAVLEAMMRWPGRRSTADIQAMIDVLLEGVSLTTDILPISRVREITESELVSGFETVDEAMLALHSWLKPDPSTELALIIKAHVIRLELQLQKLETDCVCSITLDASSEGTTQFSNHHRLHGSGADLGQGSRTGSEIASRCVERESKPDLRQLIRHYRSLGFAVASNDEILDFGTAQWFLDGLRSTLVAHTILQQNAQSTEERQQLQQQQHHHRVVLSKDLVQSDTDKTETKTPEEIVLTVPALSTLLSKNYGANKKLVHHWRRSLGVQFTLDTYLDTMREKRLQLRTVRAQSMFGREVSWRNDESEVERKIRTITAALTDMMMHHECVDDIITHAVTDGTFSEALSYAHKYLSEYGKLHLNSLKLYGSAPLQMTSIDIAVTWLGSKLSASEKRAKKWCLKGQRTSMDAINIHRCIG